MVFQDAQSAMNPVFTIGDQIVEQIKLHLHLNNQEARMRATELLQEMGIPSAERALSNYPHQLSGGMRQRAMIAQAIAANPKLIIADEPTSNLDVTLQARIIELFKRLVAELNLSIVLITHDLGVVSHMADKVAVMTEGEIVEVGETKNILENPGHRYTCQLMEALKI